MELPTGLPAGTHRLLACADGRALVSERSENNNCRTVGSLPIAVGEVSLRAHMEQTRDGVRLDTRFSWSMRLEARRRPDVSKLGKTCLDGDKLESQAAFKLLAGSSSRSPEHACARATLIEASGSVFDAPVDEDDVVVPSPDDLPRASFDTDNNHAAMTVRASWWLRDGTQRAGPFSARLETPAGRITMWARRAEVPPGTRRIITMTTSGLHDVTVSPLPSRLEGAERTWVVPEPGRRQMARLQARQDREGRIASWLSSTEWGRLIGFTMALLFPLALIVSLVRADSERGPPPARLVALALGVVLLSIWLGIAAAPAAIALFDRGSQLGPTGQEVVKNAGVAFLALSLAAACAAAWASRDRSRGSTWGVLAALIALTMALGGVWWWLLDQPQGMSESWQGWMGSGLRFVSTVLLALALVRVAFAPVKRVSFRIGAAVATAVVVVHTLNVIAEARFVSRFLSPDDGPYDFPGPNIGVLDTIPRLGEGSSVPLGALSTATALLPYAALGCALTLLAHMSPRHRALPKDAHAFNIVGVLFAGFVVGTGGVRASLVLPAGFLLALLSIAPVRRLLKPRSNAVEHLPAATSQLRELARANERFRRHQRLLDREWQSGQRTGVEYTAAKRNLDSERRVATTTAGDPDLESARQRALAPGPEGRWWGNACSAARAGALLAVLPVGFYIAVLVVRGVEHEGRGFTFAYGVAIGVTHEIVFWIVAALCLGALLAVLPRGTGPEKGVILTAAFVALAGVGKALAPVEDRVGLAFRSVELLLFLTILGARLDKSALGVGWRELGGIYRLGELRPAIAYLATLAGSVIAIGQQIYSGDASQAIQETIERAPSFLAPGTG